MINYYRSDEIAALDRCLFDLGVSGSVLMENVGRQIAQDLDAIFPAPPGPCVICAGPGNNGGDGFVVARYLALRGWEPLTILSHSRERSKGAAAENLKLLDLMELPTVLSSEMSDQELSRIFQEAAVVVDGLLGTGATGVPRGEVSRLIALMNASEGFRAAVDLPSGIEGGGLCFRAHRTFAAAAPKEVLATGPGALHSGTVSVVSLGLKVEPFLPSPSAMEPEAEDLRKWMPQRSAGDHKGSRGGVLIVAGSCRYRGAALLAARGALRSGAGLVILAAPEKVLQAAAVELPEIIGEPLDQAEGLPEILERWKERCPVVLSGPGLDRDQRAREIYRILQLWQGSKISLWDGDGLFWIAESGKPKGPFCITPHQGEAARLLGLTVPAVVAERLKRAVLLADRFGPVILKGPRSVVAAPGQTPLVIGAGDRTLAIPGSGDVLSGAAAALLAAEIPAQRALALAAWIHGKAGEKLGASLGQDGVLASQVADELPLILKELGT